MDLCDAFDLSQTTPHLATVEPDHKLSVVIVRSRAHALVILLLVVSRVVVVTTTLLVTCCTRGLFR
jgi:hypothetical protein